MNLLKSSNSKIKYIIFTTEKFPIDSPGGRRISSLLDKGLLNNVFSGLITFDKYKASDLYEFPLTLNYINIVGEKRLIIKLVLFPVILIRFLFDLIYLFSIYKIEKIYIYSRQGIFTFLISIISKIYNSEITIDCTEWFDYKEVNGFSVNFT